MPGAVAVSPERKSDVQLMVSVIVPVLRFDEPLRQFLDALRLSHYMAVEWIVVVDGGDSETVSALENIVPGVHSTSCRAGPGAARNLGAAHASGDLLLFLDADVAVHVDTISHLVDVFTEDPELDAVIGSYDDEPSETNFLSLFKNLIHHHTHQTSRADASTFWGACGAIRREVFEAIGGFNEHCRSPTPDACPGTLEDVELGYRLKRCGYRIRLAKDVQVKHLKHWNIVTLLRADLFYRARPWVRMIVQEGQILDDLNTSMVNRWSVALCYGMIGCILAALGNPLLILPAFFCMAVVVFLNRETYHFFHRKKGLLFTLIAVVWHWFYYLYCGFAFVVFYMEFKLRSKVANAEIRRQSPI